MKVKNAAKILVFCILFLFILNRIYDIFSWKDTAGDYYSSMESFYGLEKDVVDVLFLGSSHCYCSVIPAQLWEDYGMASFNMAISGQELMGTYYNLKEALKTQDLKVVCVDLFGCTLNGYDGEDGNLYRNTLSRKFSKTFVEAVDSMVETDNKLDFLLKWPIIHTRYKEVERQDFLKESPVYLGYHSEFVVSAVEKAEYSYVEAKPMEADTEKWLLKIIELAQENEVELVFFLAPYAVPVWEQEIYAYVKEIAEEYNVPVLDLVELSEEVGLNWNSDFIDSLHTNYFGAEKVTTYLGEFLKANYDLPDYRGDERYALWDLDLKTRNHELKNYQLRQIINIKTYLEEISRLEDYTVVVSTTGEYIIEENNVDEYLQLLGPFHEYDEGAAVWVFDNQENIYVSSGSEFLQSIQLSFNVDMVLGGTGGTTSVLVDRSPYQKTDRGINILVYDNLLGIVVDSVGIDAMYPYGIIR